jgi:hypothetical protein
MISILVVLALFSLSAALFMGAAALLSRSPRRRR